MQLHELTATAALRLIGKGVLGPWELARACLTRIEERDRQVGAWLSVVDEIELRKQYQACPSRPLPLPFGVKDIIDVAASPTTCNSPLYADRVAAYDADCVRLLRLKGAVPLGKTDTEEFACAGRAAATRNPHNLDHTPGGSSSGSAAAVADCMVPIALGTQTAGSVIRPASYCGIFAFKPTFGLVSRIGIKLASESLDTVGWYARCAEDLALVGVAFRIPGLPIPRRPTQPTNIKLGIDRTPFWTEADACSQAALSSAAERLSMAGFQVHEIEPLPGFDELAAAQRIIMYAEARVALMVEFVEHGSRLHPDLAAFLERSDSVPPNELGLAHDLAANSRTRFDAMFDSDLDAVLTLAAPGEAPAGLKFTGAFTFNAVWTLLHAPCIAIPGFKGNSGLPIGLQLVGPRYSDARLLRLASSIAAHLDAPHRPLAK